jgi:hypothetical protein
MRLTAASISRTNGEVLPETSQTTVASMYSEAPRSSMRVAEYP